MLIDGTIVMAIGMGTVCLFLCIMVAMMHLMAFLMKSDPAAIQEPVISHKTAGSNCSLVQNEEIAVVIAAAKAFAERKQS
jgi:sodium pump decarboxylase gamma subunit